MIAKFPGRCAACRKPINTGDEIDYDVAAKKAYCSTKCRPVEQLDVFGKSEAEELATRLGFVDAKQL